MVRGAGLATVETAGLEICLPVRDELRAEAVALERELRFLHYQNDAWTGVPHEPDSPPGRLCATVTAFFPFAVGYSDEKLGFADTGQPLVYYTGTAARAAAVDLPGATGGDGRITYTFDAGRPPGRADLHAPGGRGEARRHDHRHADDAQAGDVHADRDGRGRRHGEPHVPH